MIVRHLIPAYHSVPVLFLMDLLSTIEHNGKKFDYKVMIREDIPVDKARNVLVESALKDNADYIFFQDSDTIITPSTIERLIKVSEKYNADLVSGLYFQKTKPYYPVIRDFKHGGFWKIENPPLGKILNIGGCGMGCALIKADVFKKLENPWFKFSYEKWGEKDICLSEDLYFSRSMVENNMKLLCDTGCVCSHVGGNIDVVEYASFSEIRKEAMMEREELIQDMVSFTGLTEKDVNLKLLVGAKLVAEDWNKMNPKTPEEITNFYKTTKNYIYDLASWHFTTRRKFDVELLSALQRDKPKTILDYGCGIGQNAFMLAKNGFDVTLADVGSYTLDFAKHRFDSHNLNYSLWTVDEQPMPERESFDVILLFDVLEHIPDEIFEETINKLIKLRHKETKIYNTNSFGNSPANPTHFDLTEEKQKLIEKLLKP